MSIIPSAQQVISSLEGVNLNSRGLTALAKMYTSEDYKYNGMSASYHGSLNYEFALFGDFCKKAGVTPSMLPDAFSIMLRVAI
ncbi:hypothetical protein HI914_06816 [Erysiphe necator]|nr:hypothetical protein HI914_06816 [Erysiphe necator]